MVLICFSEWSFVSDILHGIKTHTTRMPSKRRVRVGSLLHFYFRVRNKRSCKNCVAECQWTPEQREKRKSFICGSHKSFIGSATCIKITEFIPKEASEKFLKEWAKKDGFKNYKAADAWFTKHYGSDWTRRTWVIYEWSELAYVRNKEREGEQIYERRDGNGSS